MSKCKLWNPSGIFLGVEIPQGYTLVTNGLCILGVAIGSQDFSMHFLDEVLFQDMAHIDDVATLTLGSRPRQGLTKVQAKSEAQKSHFMLPGVWENVRE